MATRAQVVDAIIARIEQDVTEMMVNVQAEVSAVTPFDTGFARANWQLTVGSPADGTVTVGGTIGELVKFRVEDGKAFVTNNAQYIQRLNGGHSQQAPAGFVEQAIARAVTP